MLRRELGRGKFERLVLVAPPKELGRLRAELSPAVRERVTAELNKDLTRLSLREMAEHLGAVIAV
jgi:protein required for attachment to host cells